MKRFLILALSLLLGASAAVLAAQPTPASAPAATQQSPAAGSAASPDARMWAFFDQYCGKCHNAEDWAGGVAFDTMTPGDIPQQGDVFEHVIAKLQGRLMPPPGKPQPDNAAVHAMVSWLEGTLDRAALTRAEDPGRVALHRLNRKEYANAVWDLLSVRVDPTAVLPADDRSDDFDNIANVLQVSPAFVDQYISSARQIAVQAVGEVPGRATGTQYVVTDPAGQQFHIEGLPLGTRGGMVVTHWFPADGEYELNIGNLAVALWVFNMEFENHLVALLDGKKFWEYTIGGEEQMKAIDQQQDPAVDAINKHLKGIRFHATAGPHQLAVSFVQRTFAESDDKLYQQMPGGGQDRVLRLSSFEVKGPFSPTGISETPSRHKIFICHPTSTADEAPCARKILANLATQAYRRPVTDTDMKLLMSFYARGRRQRDFDEGIRQGLTGILASPYFLYRAEHLPQVVATQKGPSFYRISDLELAARLSFFLWSSDPDEELLHLAIAGKLHDPEVLHSQVRRMLADKRSVTLASNFAFQWLGIDRLSEIKPDPNLFPYAGDPREDYRTEFKLFVDSIFREDHDVVDLLDAKYTFLNERLALLYGINSVRGDQFRRVELADSARWGLLGKGAVLMATSYPNRTAPVLRGNWVLSRIIGTPTAAPPPVPSLKENKTGQVAHTMRELMAQHRNKPSCYACHAILDPMGFALENFDAVGVYRTKDRIAGSPIDASGVLPDGTKMGGVDDLRNALVANPQQFVQTLTEKLMIYATGRNLTWRDMPTIRAIVRDTAKDHYRFSSIVLHIVDSDQFQMRSIAPGVAPTTTAQNRL